MAQTEPTAILAGIGAEIRAARSRLGMLQVELASALGVSRDTVSRYEKGSTPIPVVTLLKVSEILGVPLTELTSPRPAALSRAA